MTFRRYIDDLGWKLCAINPGQKGPTYAQWQLRPVPADAIDGFPGAGLLHALSGTAALDIDNLTLATGWLAERDVDLQALLEADNAVMISSGRPNRAKLLYRLSKPMRSFAPEHSGLELRCASKEGTSVQDVLPPSVHPITDKPYEWKFGLLGDLADLPGFPPTLLKVWRDLAEAVKVEAALPAAAPPQMTLAEVEKLLKQKPNNDLDYDQWLAMGMALHSATGGSREGMQLWHDWSRTSTKYTGWDYAFPKYASFKVNGGVTAGSLKKDTIAAADEFDEVTPEEIAAASEGDNVAEEVVQEKRQRNSTVAEALLVERLVYVQIMERYFDTMKHHLVGNDNALVHQYQPLMPMAKKGRLDPVKILKNSTTKRYVKAMGFHPGEGAIFTEDGNQFANMFCNTAPTPIPPMKDELDKIQWMFARLEDDAYSKWLQQFFGHIVQFPGVKIGSAPLLWSEETGNGKNTLLKEIPALLVGKHYSHDVTSDELSSTFTDFLYGAWHVYLPEFRADTRGERKAITTKMKPWITDSTVSVHPKGRASYTMPNHFFITATSNEEDAAAIDANDRRWAVHEFPAKRLTPTETKWIYDEFIRLPRAAAVLRHYFLNVDLTGFHPKAAAPITASRESMIETSRGQDVEGLIAMWEAGEAPFDRDMCTAQQIIDAVQHRHWAKFLRPNTVARILKKPPFNAFPEKYSNHGKSVRALIFRNVEVWRVRLYQDVKNYLEGDDISLDDDPLLS